MKIILLFCFFCGVISAVGYETTIVFAATEKSFCDCTGQVEKIQGKECVFFSSSTVQDNICPNKCIRGSGDPPAGVICVDLLVSGTPTTSTVSGLVSSNKNIVKLDNPLVGDVKDITIIIGNVIKVALGVMGGLVLLMIVWGGFTWLTAAGNPEKIKSGSNTILWAVLGAVVVLGSYALLTFVLQALAGTK